MTYTKVRKFNREILGIKPHAPGPLSSEESEISIKCLLEEIEEFDEAVEDGVFIDQVDAIIDLIYFAHGILYKMGINEQQFEAIFDVVHKANMTKKIGVNAKRDTGAKDAVKPKDWVSPEKEIERIIFGPNGQEELDI